MIDYEGLRDRPLLDMGQIKKQSEISENLAKQIKKLMDKRGLSPPLIPSYDLMYMDLKTKTKKD